MVNETHSDPMRAPDLATRLRFWADHQRLTAARETLLEAADELERRTDEKRESTA